MDFWKSNLIQEAKDKIFEVYCVMFNITQNNTLIPFSFWFKKSPKGEEAWSREKSSKVK